MFVQYSSRLAHPQHTKEKQPKDDELLERLLKDEINHKTNVVQSTKFSELLSLTRARAMETVQVIEELIELAKKFREAANLKQAEVAGRMGRGMSPNLSARH